MLSGKKIQERFGSQVVRDLTNEHERTLTEKLWEDVGQDERAIHILPAERPDAYDITQTDELIQDGDILVVGDVVAIMVRAWPTVFYAPQDAETFGFHALAEWDTWETFDSGVYAATSTGLAQVIGENHEAFQA